MTQRIRKKREKQRKLKRRSTWADRSYRAMWRDFCERQRREGCGGVADAWAGRLPPRATAYWRRG